MPKKLPNLCTKNMTFEECELAIVRQAVQMIEDKAGKKKIDTPEIKDIIRIVEEFLQETKRICYGGTAINNLLPIYEQFYNKEVELPDYDFDVIFYANERNGLDDEHYDRYCVDRLRDKYKERPFTFSEKANDFLHYKYRAPWKL